MIIEEVVEEFKEYYKDTNLMKTLEKMWVMKHSFNSVQDVENEIINVLEYMKILNGLSKEIGLQKNELSELKRTEYNTKALHIHLSSINKNNELGKKFATDTARSKYLTLRCNQELEPIKKIEADYNVILDFINDQKWTMKSYLAELQERRKYQVAIRNIEKDY